MLFQELSSNQNGKVDYDAECLYNLSLDTAAVLETPIMVVHGQW